MTKSYVRYDDLKNRIYLFLEGSHDITEATRMKNEYIKAIQKAKPNFTVLADLSTYIPGSNEVQQIHAEAVKFAEKGGVAKVARIVGNTPLGGMQISRIARKEVKYPSKSFMSVEEAEDYLDNKFY